MTIPKVARDAASSAAGNVKILHGRVRDRLSGSEIGEIVDAAILAALPHLGEPVCWRIDETMPGGSIKWRCVEHQHHAMQVGAESVFPAVVYPLFKAPHEHRRRPCRCRKPGE